MRNRWAQRALIAACAALFAPGVQAAAADVDERFGRSGALIGTGGDLPGPFVREADGRLLVAQSRLCGARCSRITVDRRTALGGRVGSPGTTRAGVPPAAIVRAGPYVWAVGSTAAGLSLSRFDGSLRASVDFGRAGTRVVGLPAGLVPKIAGAVGLPDGGLIVGGSARVGGRGYGLLCRILPDGELETSFGGGGVIAPVAGATDVEAHALVAAPDGGLLLAGQAATARGRRVMVARFNADGVPDVSFGTAGASLVDVPGAVQPVGRALVVQGGRILVAGDARVGRRRRAVVMRLRARGERDPGFGSAGIGLADFGRASLDRLAGLVVQPDGALIVVANARLPGASRGIALQRLGADGSVDPGDHRSDLAAVALLPGGRLTTLEASSVAGTPSGDILVRGTARRPSPTGFLLRVRG